MPKVQVSAMSTVVAEETVMKILNTLYGEIHG
jgi:hypothetical protein